MRSATCGPTVAETRSGRIVAPYNDIVRFGLIGGTYLSTSFRRQQPHTAKRRGGSPRLTAASPSGVGGRLRVAEGAEVPCRRAPPVRWVVTNLQLSNRVARFCTTRYCRAASECAFPCGQLGNTTLANYRLCAELAAGIVPCFRLEQAPTSPPRGQQSTGCWPGQVTPVRAANHGESEPIAAEGF
jgi:hypothetical protein